MEEINKSDHNVRQRLVWNKKEDNHILTLDGKKVMEVVPLYWLKWPDGELSADKYNLSRAKQHAMDVVCQEYRVE